MGILDVDSQLSLVYSHLSCITWGPMCRLYPWTRELALAIFHDVITYQAGCGWTDSVSILVYVASYWLVVGRTGKFSQTAGFLIGIARLLVRRGSPARLGLGAQQYADLVPYWDSGWLLAGRICLCPGLSPLNDILVLGLTDRGWLVYKPVFLLWGHSSSTGEM